MHTNDILNAYSLITRKDRELGQAFNDFRRSTAVIQIRIIRNLSVVTDNELATKRKLLLRRNKKRMKARFPKVQVGR